MNEHWIGDRTQAARAAARSQWTPHRAQQRGAHARRSAAIAEAAHRAAETAAGASRATGTLGRAMPTL